MEGTSWGGTLEKPEEGRVGPPVRMEEARTTVLAGGLRKKT